MQKIILLLTFLSIMFYSCLGNVYANSSYVLPYPSSMPGSIFYKFHLIKDVLLKYWYFGDFGQFTYNLKESDKYLVEAKTLFEYNQYLLAYNSLQKSNEYFSNTKQYLLNAKKHNKDITKNLAILKEATKKHQEVLGKLKNELPKEFIWSPEKAPQETLEIEKLLNESIALRENYEKINL